MKFKLNDPPRVFEARKDAGIWIKGCGRINLKPNEQVTFTTEKGAEYDVARKEWGYYATPSLDGRLRRFGLRAVLVKSSGEEKFYLFLVEKGRERKFREYLRSEGHRIICWMDSNRRLKKMERMLKR